jgi:hypothetical protein
MKISELTIILKQVVKEVFHEEMKEILLEAVKAPKNSIIEYQRPSTTLLQPSSEVDNPSNLSESEKQILRNNYKSLIEGPSRTPQSQKSQGYNPQRFIDTASESSQLPEGEVSLDQISQFIMPKQ